MQLIRSTECRRSGLATGALATLAIGELEWPVPYVDDPHSGPENELNEYRDHELREFPPSDGMRTYPRTASHMGPVGERSHLYTGPVSRMTSIDERSRLRSTHMSPVSDGRMLYTGAVSMMSPDEERRRLYTAPAEQVVMYRREPPRMVPVDEVGAYSDDDGMVAVDPRLGRVNYDTRVLLERPGHALPPPMGRVYGDARSVASTTSLSSRGRSFADDVASIAASNRTLNRGDSSSLVSSQGRAFVDDGGFVVSADEYEKARASRKKKNCCLITGTVATILGLGSLCALGYLGYSGMLGTDWFTTTSVVEQRLTPLPTNATTAMPRPPPSEVIKTTTTTTPAPLLVESVFIFEQERALNDKLKLLTSVDVVEHMREAVAATCEVIESGRDIFVKHLATLSPLEQELAVTEYLERIFTPLVAAYRAHADTQDEFQKSSLAVTEQLLADLAAYRRDLMEEAGRRPPLDPTVVKEKLRKAGLALQRCRNKPYKSENIIAGYESLMSFTINAMLYE